MRFVKWERESENVLCRQNFMYSGSAFEMMIFFFLFVAALTFERICNGE